LPSALWKEVSLSTLKGSDAKFSTLQSSYRSSHNLSGAPIRDPLRVRQYKGYLDRGEQPDSQGLEKLVRMWPGIEILFSCI
jgi:hypothetical protein